MSRKVEKGKDQQLFKADRPKVTVSDKVFENGGWRTVEGVGVADDYPTAETAAHKDFDRAMDERRQ
jgi:hypothetical protein